MTNDTDTDNPDDQTEDSPELCRKTGIGKTQRTIERLHALADDGEIEFLDPKGGPEADTEGGDG